MAPKPHSQTVRGTLDNPKTKEAMNSDKPTPQLGDATSLKPEKSNKELPSNDSAPPTSDQKGESSNDSESTSDAKDKDLPHSKTVRGTLANTDGKKVDKKQLGDPTSLKAENNRSEMDKDVEREGQDKSGKSKL